MQKISTIILVLISLVSSGCWIRLPSHGVGSSKDHVGNTYTLKRDIIIAKSGRVLEAFEIDRIDEMNGKGKNFTTIPTDSEITIKSIVQITEESGVWYFYACKTEANQKFDMNFEMRDCIGLPKYSHWTNDTGANKSLE